MGGVQGSALAIAVSNAGGLGSVPCGLLGLDAIREELKAVRAATTQPFNVNFFCHTPPTPDTDRDSAWRAALAPYYRELGIDQSTIVHSVGRSPFTFETADVLDEFEPPVVRFPFGLPARELLAHVRRWRPLILACATTVDEARWLEANGVDAIVAQGIEAGGHRGMFLTDDVTSQVGTFALLPQIVDAVNVPVIAAGGIADERGVAAAFRLGAAAVQVGTAYMLCDESTTSPIHRTALASEAARHTALTNVFTGRLARGIVNRIMRELGPISPIAPPFPSATPAILPLRAAGEAAGSSDFSPLWAGQNASGCRSVPAADLTHELAAGVP
jgi:nitronate monooxygenase